MEQKENFLKKARKLSLALKKGKRGRLVKWRTRNTCSLFLIKFLKSKGFISIVMLTKQKHYKKVLWKIQ